MTSIPKAKLKDFFGLFDPELILGTTYTLSLAFFESVVWPSIKDKSNLRRCLILCDKFGFQRAIRESAALQRAAREYVVAVAPHSRAFHAKVWLMMNQERLALLVGSGNLTQSGFVENVELFEVVELETESSKIRFTQQVAEFVKGLQRMWGERRPETLVALDTLTEITRGLENFANDDSKSDIPEFLHSFNADFASAVAEITGKASLLNVVSPYFGGSLAGLELLRNALSPSQTVVFPAVHHDNTVDLPVDALGSDVVAKRSKKITGKSGFVHAKQYGIKSEANEHWTLTGSVNCTQAAISATNVEAAILRRIDDSSFEDYFVVDESNSVPTDQRSEEYESAAGWLTFWATDVGSSIRLVFSDAAASKFPLKDVEIRLQIGARVFVKRTDLLQIQDGEHTLAWKSFGELASRNRNATAWLEIKTAGLAGKAFVDDMVSLTAEPIHRGAWRTTMAMMSAEGMPDYADLANLFSLVSHITTESRPDDEAKEQVRVAGSTERNRAEKAPVWPPIPISKSTGGLLSGKTGHVYWFNRILASMVSKDAMPPADRSTTEVDADDESGAEKVVTPGQVWACKRVWSQAEHAFFKMIGRLQETVVDQSLSKTIWGSSIFVCLAALCSKAAAHKGSEGQVETQPTSSLIRPFLQSMFGLRYQGDDYARLASCRYSTDYFPPIARDLADEFDSYPAPEIVSIVLVFFAHLKATVTSQSSSLFPFNDWLAFRDVAGDMLADEAADREHLKNVWERYVNDRRGEVYWKDVEKALDQLERQDWNQHPGIGDMQQLIAASKTPGSKISNEKLQANFELLKRTGFKRASVNSLDTGCDQQSCSNQYKVNPLMRRELRSLRPYICESCGTLLIPSELVSAYKRNNKK